MTRRERREIAAVVRCTMNDGCNEIRNAYLAKFGSIKGLRDYVRRQAIAFWTDFDPYLEKEYLDLAWVRVGGKIVNYDDFWCFVRDFLKQEG